MKDIYKCISCGEAFHSDTPKPTCGKKECYNNFYNSHYKQLMRPYQDRMLQIRDQDKLIDWIRNSENKFRILFSDFKKWGIYPELAGQIIYANGEISKLVYLHFELIRSPYMKGGDFFIIKEIPDK